MTSVWPALLAGAVAVACGMIAAAGVVYSARSQKEPTIIKVTQEVAADAIATLMRERDEARAKVEVQRSVIADLSKRIVVLESEGTSPDD